MKKVRKISFLKNSVNNKIKKLYKSFILFYPKKKRKKNEAGKRWGGIYK